MKTFIRLLVLSFIPFAFSSDAVAAETVHLFLKGNNGKTYKTKTDAAGKFNFDNIEPGKYELIWVMPDGVTPDNTESASIEIESFSWGATQISHHGSTTSSNQRTVEPAAAVPGGSPGKPTSGPSGDRPTGQPTPPPGIQSGGDASGSPTGKRGKGNVENTYTAYDLKSMTGGKYYTVVLKDVVISSVSTFEGTCGKMAINEKGVPGKKKSHN